MKNILIARKDAMLEVSPKNSTRCNYDSFGNKLRNINENVECHKLYEEALKFDLGSIDEDWFNGSFEEHCSFECPSSELKHEKVFDISESHLYDTFNICLKSEECHSTREEITTELCSERLEESFFKQKYDSHLPKAALDSGGCNESAMELCDIQKSDCSKETESNFDQRVMFVESKHNSYNETSEKTHDCLPAYSFSQKDSMYHNMEHCFLQQLRNNSSVDCTEVLDSPVGEKESFVNWPTTLTEKCRIKQTSQLASQLLKWSPITQAEMDECSPRVFPIFQSPLDTFIKSSTPRDITQSLGIQSCGKDMEWNSAMETPLGAIIGIRHGEREQIRNKVTCAAVHAKVIPRTLFTEGSVLPEDEKSSCAGCLLNISRQSSQQNINESTLVLINNLKEYDIENSVQCNNNDKISSTNTFSEPKVVTDAVQQNIADVLRSFISSQKVYDKDISPHRFNVGKYPNVNATEGLCQDTSFKEVSNMSLLSGEHLIQSANCSQQGSKSALSIQETLSFLFTKESNATLKGVDSENKENCVKNELNENKKEESGQSSRAESSVRVVENDIASGKAEPPVAGLMVTIDKLQTTPNKQCAFSGFCSASGKCINVNEHSLKQVEIMWEKVRNDPWVSGSYHSVNQFQKDDVNGNKLFEFKSAPSPRKLAENSSDIIPNKIDTIHYQESCMNNELSGVASSNKSIGSLSEITLVEPMLDSLNVSQCDNSSFMGSQHCCNWTINAQMPLDNIDHLPKEDGNESQSLALVDVPLTQLLEVAESTYICLKEMEQSPSQIQILPRCGTKRNRPFSCSVTVQSPKNYFNKSPTYKKLACCAVEPTQNVPSKNEQSTTLESNNLQNTAIPQFAGDCSIEKCLAELDEKKATVCFSEKTSVSEGLNACYTKFNGFMTAAGKKVNISSTAFEKSRQLFVAFSEKTKEEVQNDKIVDCIRDYFSDVKNEISDRDIERNEHDIKNKITEKTKETFENVSNRDKVTTENSDNQLINDLGKDEVLNGFSKEHFKDTELNKITNVNEKDLAFHKNDDHHSAATAQKCGKGDKNCMLFDTNYLEKVPAFCTASGRRIMISQQSLIKAKSLLSEDLVLPNETNARNVFEGKENIDLLDDQHQYVPAFDMENFMACSQGKNGLSDPSDKKFFIRCIDAQRHREVHIDETESGAMLLGQESNEKSGNGINKRAEKSETVEKLRSHESCHKAGSECSSSAFGSDDLIESELFMGPQSSFFAISLVEKNLCTNNEVATAAFKESQHAANTMDSHTTRLMENIESGVNDILKDDIKLIDETFVTENQNLPNKQELVILEDNQSISDFKIMENQANKWTRNFNKDHCEEANKRSHGQDILHSELLTSSGIPTSEKIVNNKSSPLLEKVDTEVIEFHKRNNNNSSTQISDSSSVNYANFGFTAASGRKVEVLTNLLSKVKTSLHNSNTNHKEKSTKGVTENIFKVPGKRLEDVTNTLHTSVKKNDQYSSNANFIGFTTASGKKVDILATSVSKAKMILDSTEQKAGNVREEQSESRNHYLVEDGLEQCIASQLLHPNPSECKDQYIEPQHYLCQQDKHVQQALSHNIVVSEDLKLIPTCRNEAKQSVIACTSAKLSELCYINKELETSMKGDDISFNQSKDPVKKHCDNNENGTTATSYFSSIGDSITVEKQSLEVEKTFDDDESRCLDATKRHVANEIIQSEEKANYPECVRKKCDSGFSTSAGKVVTISTESLEAAKALLETTDERKFEEAEMFAKNEHCNIPICENNAHSFQPIGFATASGKDLHISKCSLDHVKQLLQRCELDILPARYNSLDTDTVSSADLNLETLKGSEHETNNSKTTCELIRKECGVKSMNNRPCTLAGSSDRDFASASINCEFISPFKVDKVSSKRVDREVTATGPSQKRSRIAESLPENIANISNSCVIEIINVRSKCETYVEEKRRHARKCQEERINHKREIRVLPMPGILWKKKTSSNVRKTLRDAVGNLYPGSIKSEFSAEERHFMSYTDPSRSRHFTFKASDYFDQETCNDSAEISIADSMVIIINDQNEIGFDELCRAFLDGPGVDPNLISKKWITNHYSWIIWKLASMEISFPSLFKKQCLTPENVLLQLKYRYDKEIDNAQRSALKKITEQDDTPAKTMILCVAGINAVKQSDKERNPAVDIEYKKNLLLTDGWYSIPAFVDNAMQQLIMKGKVAVGQKIIVSCAELTGSDVPCSPTEAPSELMLKICTNSVRRARWDAKLGYFSSPKPFPVSFCSIYSDGGLIGCINCIVQRVYPLLFMEKYPNGNLAFHNGRVEAKIADDHLKLRELQLEKLAESVQKEFEELLQEKENKKEKKKKKSCTLQQTNFQKLNTGKEIYEAVDVFSDFGTIEIDLNTQQKHLLLDYKSKLQSEQREQLEEMMKQRINEAVGENKLIYERITVPMLKILLSGTSEADRRKRCTCLLTVWQPSENALQFLIEGRSVSIYHLMPGASRKWKNQISLNSSKRTYYEENPVNEHLMQSCFIPRKVSCFTEINTNCAFGEVDVVGIVISITSPLNENGVPLQLVYLGDQDLKFLAVKFPKGISALGMEDILQPGNLVAASNLSVECCNYYIPAVIASELSIFTCCPKTSHLKSAMQHMQSSTKDVPTYLSEAQDLLRRIQLSGPITARGLPPNSVSPVFMPDKEVTPTDVKVAVCSRRRAYPVYSPLCLQSRSPVCVDVSRTPHTPKCLSPQSAIMKTDTVCAAELRSHEIRTKIRRLSNYGSAPPLPILTSPASACTMKPFLSPRSMQVTTPLTTKRRGLRQWRGKTLTDTNENNLQGNSKV